MDETTYTLVINRPGQPTWNIAVGLEALRALVYAVSDNAANAELVGTLAHHPAASIRAVVASYRCLEKDVVERLEDDVALEVRRALLQSRAFQTTVTTERLSTFASSDPELAAEVAENLDLYTEIDVAAVTEKLVHHSDPAVRIALARCGATPNLIRRKLTRDSDVDVARTAREAQPE